MQRSARLLRDRSGIVIIGPLIAFVIIFSGMVIIGMIINRTDAPPPTPLPRELRYAATPVEVRFGGRITARKDSGEVLWVRMRPEGGATVYASEESNVIIGFVDDSVLTRSRQR